MKTKCPLTLYIHQSLSLRIHVSITMPKTMNWNSTRILERAALTNLVLRLASLTSKLLIRHHKTTILWRKIEVLSSRAMQRCSARKQASPAAAREREGKPLLLRLTNTKIRMVVFQASQVFDCSPLSELEWTLVRVSDMLMDWAVQDLAIHSDKICETFSLPIYITK